MHREISRPLYRIGPIEVPFLGLRLYRILHMNPEKELLWGLWVLCQVTAIASEPADVRLRLIRIGNEARTFARINIGQYGRYKSREYCLLRFFIT